MLVRYEWLVFLRHIRQWNKNVFECIHFCEDFFHFTQEKTKQTNTLNLSSVSDWQHETKTNTKTLFLLLSRSCQQQRHRPEAASKWNVWQRRTMVNTKRRRPNRYGNCVWVKEKPVVYTCATHTHIHVYSITYVHVVYRILQVPDCLRRMRTGDPYGMMVVVVWWRLNTIFVKKS